MSLPDAKALKKFADACRKAGIKTFKNAEFEFTLTDDLPVSNYKKKRAEQETAISLEVETEQLTEEQLLFYSVADVIKQ